MKKGKFYNELSGHFEESFQSFHLVLSRLKNMPINMDEDNNEQKCVQFSYVTKM